MIPEFLKAMRCLTAQKLRCAQGRAVCGFPEPFSPLGKRIFPGKNPENLRFFEKGCCI
jgi:hypothetical protein